MFLTKEKNSPYYQVVYFIHGKRTKKSTRKKTRTEAQKFMIEFAQRLESPNPPSEQLPEVSKTASNILISKFRDEYVEYVQDSKSKHYIRSIKLSFKKLIDYAGDISLLELDLKTLDKFISYTYAKAPRAAALYYRTLKAAFSKAVIWEYLSSNPLKKIKAPKNAKKLPIFINEGELLVIIGNTEEQYLKDIFLAAFHTGMRQAELLNMKWNWIDFKNEIITVTNSETFTTKSKRERIIPISSTLKKCLTKRRNVNINTSNHDFVFTKTPGVKINEDYVSKKFKKVVRDLNLNDEIHFHTLRHSFASMLVQKGVSLYVVKELLGHEDLTTTQIYSHLQQQNLRDAVNLL